MKRMYISSNEPVTNSSRLRFERPHDAATRKRKESNMTHLKLIAAVGAIVAIGATVITGPAAAGDPLSAWEKFCLRTSSPGQDLANCLDGLPSRGGRNNVLVAPGGGQSGLAIRTRTRVTTQK